MAEHLLTLDSLGREGVLEVLDLARRFKQSPGIGRQSIDGGRLGMIFDKPSTRTRVSFEAAAWQLGMLPVTLRPDELQLGHGETVADTARVLSRYLSALVIRTFAQSRVEELAEFSSIPIINALTDDHHPCQALADVMSLQEEFGDLSGVTMAFVGDGNNVCHSLIQAAGYLGFRLVIATPEGFEPNAGILADGRRHAAENGGEIVVVKDPVEAVTGADAVYTDVWVSMGEEDKPGIKERVESLRPYQVNGALMAASGKSSTIFLHCLPAHHTGGVHDMEVTEDVFESRASKVFDEAENRLHTIKAVMVATMT